MSYYEPLEGSQAYIYAKYSKGKVIDLDTDKPLELKEGAVVKITVDKLALPTKDAAKFHKTEVSKEVLKAETKLEFALGGTPYSFIINLLDDLIFRKQGNKNPVAENCRMKITEMFDVTTGKKTRSVDFKEVEVDSLNQAYFLMSVKYKPNAKSHSVNVYKQFYLKGDRFKTLEIFRNF